MKQGKHQVWSAHSLCAPFMLSTKAGERSGSVVERWTPEQEVGGSKSTSAVLCP